MTITDPNASPAAAESSKWLGYYTAQTGGVVCVNLHPGGLGIAWYKVLHC